jgi:hypothetical protein
VLFSIEGSRARSGRLLTTPCPADLPGFRAAMAADRCFVGEIRRISSRRAALFACAPIHDAGGKRVGVLGVETAAEEYGAATRRLWLRGAGITGSVLLLGLMVVTALSGLVTREIRGLTGAVREVQSGNMSPRLQPGRIQEVADLSNTFSTLTDVQQDVLTRTRRMLIEGEQFRTEADLACCYVEQCCTPLGLDLGGVRIAARHVSAGSPADRRASGSFYDAFRTPAGLCCALVGQVTLAGALQSAIEASAAGACLRRELSERPPQAALATALTRFSFDRLACLCWRPDHETADFWQYTAAGAPPERSAVPLRPQVARALHTFAPEPAALIQCYVEAFAALSPAELLEDLAAALPSGAAGSLLVLKAVTSNE